MHHTYINIDFYVILSVSSLLYKRVWPEIIFFLVTTGSELYILALLVLKQEYSKITG